MHYMHYKDYIHHGLAAEKTPPPLPQGGEPSGWGGGVGVPCSYIYIYIIIRISLYAYTCIKLYQYIDIQKYMVILLEAYCYGSAHLTMVMVETLGIN